MSKFKTICLILLGLIGIKSAIAYIDPGTGGMIVSQGIWPFIAAVFAAIMGFLLKYFFRPIKRGFKLLWAKIKRKD